MKRVPDAGKTGERAAPKPRATARAATVVRKRGVAKPAEVTASGAATSKGKTATAARKAATAMQPSVGPSKTVMSKPAGKASKTAVPKPRRPVSAVNIARAAAQDPAAPRPRKTAKSITGAVAPGPARRMRRDEIGEMFARLHDANPTPTTELEYTTPYELLVAVALSAQMTDVGVNKATRRLFPVANTPRAIADLGVEGLRPYIANVNFHRTKATNVVAMAHRLLELHGGQVPREREALEALPGVGRKTANVVLNTAFGEIAMAVDTHIFRVSNRTGLAPGRTVRDVEDELLRSVPDGFLRDAHHWLILHGRYTCKARVPECPRCIVRDLCQYTAKTPGAPPPLEVAPERVGKKKPPGDRGRRRGNG